MKEKANGMGSFIETHTHIFKEQFYILYNPPITD